MEELLDYIIVTLALGLIIFWPALFTLAVSYLFKFDLVSTLASIIVAEVVWLVYLWLYYKRGTLKQSL